MEPSAEGRPDALSECRRIYLGNLHYVLKSYDIEEVLLANGFDDVENIHISIDPMSARNPGYCFVDFGDRATAERALSSLRATIRGRQLKVGPCEPKTKRRGGDRAPAAPAAPAVFKRWGDWRSAPSEAAGAPASGRPHSGQVNEKEGPRAALAHFDEMIEHYQGRRVYVGGLTKMIDQAQNNQEIRDVFTGFNPVVIGKRITPHESTREMEGNYHYCFLDFETKEEAEAAVKALNATPYQGGWLKVSMAKGIPDKLINNRADLRTGHRPRRSMNAASENAGEPKRAMTSRDWRRKDE